MSARSCKASYLVLGEHSLGSVLSVRLLILMSLVVSSYFLVFKQLAVLYSDCWPRGKGEHRNSRTKGKKENESFTSTGTLKNMSQ